MTPFGAKLREMRRKRGITLKEMAETLQVSSAYLSALEHGRRGRPTWFMVQRIITFFNVIWDEAEELQRLAEVSDPRITVDTAGLEPEATELANLLSTKIGGLSKDSLNHLIHQLRVVAAKDGI
ncbi:helix-turn-helix transcriptional regulator [Breoghania sp.]|uniref:helix-turn-helix domain-containing protein n=1 Tax=Breoghania sp. TaxID=2065378 RepID=UPI00262FEE4C|nr:helix-turn-helix transcriptional regulator [Breoghania sp.]MDJ0933602.1 helix-turn-helix transcriptional regulator [Breoghania sp.]